MPVAKFTTDFSEILSVPLVELASPANLRPVLLFIAYHATPCVAEGLMEMLTRSLMQLVGCARSIATTMLHRAKFSFISDLFVDT